MNCASFREALWTALDEGLSSPVAAHEHAHGCPACRAYAEAAAKLHDLLPEAFAPVAIPSLSETVLDALSRPGMSPAESAGETATALLCAALLAAGLCLYLGYDPAGTLPGGSGSSFAAFLLDALHSGKHWLDILSGLPMPWLAPLSALAGALWISTHHAVISDSQGGV